MPTQIQISINQHQVAASKKAQLKGGAEMAPWLFIGW